MLKRNRAIRLKPDQAKAGIYVEELLNIIHWLREQPLEPGECHLVNGVSDPVLTFNRIGEALGQVRSFGKPPLSVPGAALKLAIGGLMPLAGLFPSGSRFHPRRLAKLVSANDIRPARLKTLNYPYAWPLERALADWLEKGL
jgi:hypothetical protein